MTTPLELKFIITKDLLGKEEKVPALHPQWKENKQFVLYHSPPLAVTDQAAIEEWQERLRFIEDDLHWLLRLPHDKFWVQVVFDESLQSCIDSYLKNSPRSYDVVFALPAEAKDIHDRVHRLMFMTCVRMATHKESKEHCITPSVFGDILYENFVFDIPKLMDLCILYRDGNSTLLNKMIINIFNQQPSYQQDLYAVVPTVAQVLDQIQEKCGLGADSCSPKKLTTSHQQKDLLAAMPSEGLQDLIFYLADTGATLWSFLDVYPPAAKAFWEEHFPIRLAIAYEVLFPALKDALSQKTWPNNNLPSMLRNKLLYAQSCFLRIFRQIIFQSCLLPILDHSSQEECEKHVEGYLQIMATILSERRFLAHLESLFPFEEDKDLLSQSEYGVDETRLAFIHEGIMEAYATFGKRRSKKQMTPAAAAMAATSASCQTQDAAAATPSLPPGGTWGTNVNLEDMGAFGGKRVTPVEVDSMISSIRDLLPHLGDGYIEACLDEFNYSVEDTINAVLENRLPAALEDLDPNMPRKPRAPEEDPINILEERTNVYDNDEFDVFHSDQVDTSKIHQGKKEKVERLDDKSTIHELRSTYEKYSEVVDVEEVVASGFDEYDDEYDDTYDMHDIGAIDDDSADELTQHRPFTVPRVLGGGRRNNRYQEEQEESESEESPARDQFVEDPAKIRERQQARWASRQGHAGRRPPAQQPESTRNRDVKGNPKGQGQDKEVLQNRAYKEKHKATRAKHNQRALADKKRRV